MPIKHVKIVNSLTEFLKLIHQTEFLKYTWYRGQQYSEYRLIPSRFRESHEIRHEYPYQKSSTFIVQNDMLALKTFKELYQGLCGKKEYGDIYYLYLMQHYDIPTRLLDFSLNPLVALYFSVAEDSPVNLEEENMELNSSLFDFNKESSAVFCIDPHFVNHHAFGTDEIVDLSSYQFESLENLDLPVCITPRESQIDNRLVRQSGVFVCFGRYVEALDYYDIIQTNMLKIIIPNSKRAAIKRQLKREFNIDKEFLLPDINNTSSIIEPIKEEMKKLFKEKIEKIKASQKDKQKED